MVRRFPIFQDNYIWVLTINDTGSIYIIDPGDSESVLEFLKKSNLTLKGILITHHHPDHVNGINCILAHQPVPVFGTTRIKEATHTVSDKDILSLSGHKFEVLSIPGHTYDHVAYYCAKESLLFSGDTLFSGGCGRIFEGTPQQMYESLSLLSSLPPSTKIYCSHEYTEANINFAMEVDPENKSLIKYKEKVKVLRINNKATIPTTVGLEKKINPFLRANEKSIQDAASHYLKKENLTPIEAFTAIRKWKDSY
ncbi:MAG: hydroxyacylglutathione hydrolase [Porticoccus sp.]|nr:hydroxyacylglutathione hydrolase [Porticoccus sp.]